MAASEPLFAIQTRSGIGYIDATGDLRVEPVYDNGMWESGSDGLVAVQREGRWGFVDQTGREVIECQYDATEVPYVFSEGRACVCLDGKWIVIDSAGRFVFKRSLDPPASGSRYRFSGGRIAVRYEGLGRWLGLSGQFVGGAAFGHTRSFSEGLAAATGSGDARRWGYVDDEASWVVQPRFDMAGSFRGGKAAVARNRRWGFIDTRGDLVIPQTYDGAVPFREDRAFVRRGRVWAILNASGEVVGPHTFLSPFDSPTGALALAVADAESFATVAVKPLHARSGPGSGAPPYRYGFAEGLAAVRTAQGWGYVDRTGELVIEPQFALAGSFSDGVAVVAEGEGPWPRDWFYIDTSGEPIDEVGWGVARRLVGGIGRVQDGDRVLYVGGDGGQVYPQRQTGLLARLRGILGR